MVKRINLTLGMGFLALLLVGSCATGGPGASRVDAQGRERLAAISLLPECTETETVTGDRTDQIEGCHLKAGKSGPHLVVTSDPIEYAMLGPAGFVSVSVTSRKGQHIGDFAEVTHGHYGYPMLRDVDGDGRQDVVIPRATDAVNEVYSVWLQQQNGDFSHAGELTANQITWSSRGLIAAAQRTGVSEWAVSYFRADAGKLQEVALVTGQGSEPPERGGACKIVRIAEGAEPGRFCAQR